MKNILKPATNGVTQDNGVLDIGPMLNLAAKERIKVIRACLDGKAPARKNEEDASGVFGIVATQIVEANYRQSGGVCQPLLFGILPTISRSSSFRASGSSLPR